MQVLNEGKTYISKLRVKGFCPDTLAAKLNFEKILTATDFLPKGIPSKSIILIKSLRDPAPHTLRFDNADSRHSESWRNSVAAEVARLYHRAARPIRETVSLNTDCIVFADDSELLACLAKDWLRGTLADCWWWKSLFPNLFYAGTIFRTWFEKSESIPVALQILSKQNLAVNLAGKLKPVEVSALLQKIIQTYGLSRIHDALFDSVAVKKETDSVSTNSVKKQTELSGLAANLYSPKRFPPWISTVQEALNPSLNNEQQIFLGVSLMIFRSPRIVRTAEFAEQLNFWRNESLIMQPNFIKAGKNFIVAKIQPTQIQLDKAGSKPVADLKKPFDNFSGENYETSKTSSKSSKIKFENTDSTEIKKNNLIDSTKRSEADALPDSKKFAAIPTKPVFSFDEPDFAKSAEIKKNRTQTVADKYSETQNQDETNNETEIEFSFFTNYGGIFFLLNIGLHLNLYRDFTESWDNEIDLNIWDFTAIVAEYFLNTVFKDDSVSHFLFKLSGREPDEKIGFINKDWRIPPDWLKTFQTNENFIWAKNRHNILIHHPAGFCLIDCLLKTDLQTQLKNESAIYNISHICQSNSAKFRKSKTWLTRLCEFIEVRMRQALRLENNTQINEILFARKAQIVVSATHLDVYFSLADLPIEVRMSGIDRNPGWIPAAGKFVNFHFV